MFYLKKIALDNFRIFNSDTHIHFSQITVLTGANNSGKSSLFKSLLLLKENLRGGLFSDLNFAVGNHNLGDFNSTKSRVNAGNNTVKFTLDMIAGGEDTIRLELHYSPYPNFPEKAFIRYLGVDWLENGEAFDLIRIERVLDDQQFPIESFNISVNLRNFITHKFTEYAYLIDPKALQKKLAAANEHLPSLAEHIDLSLYQYAIEGVSGKLGDYSDVDSLLSTPLGDFAMWDLLGENPFWQSQDGRLFLLEYNDYNLDDPDEDEMGYRRQAVEYIFDEVLGVSGLTYKMQEWIEPVLEYHVVSQIADIQHLGAFRGNSKRIFSLVDENSLDSILFDFIQRYDKLKPNEKTFLDTWISRFGIGEELLVQRLSGIGTIVKVRREGELYDLTDLGFAFAQLLPIILKVILVIHGAVNELSEIRWDEEEESEAEALKRWDEKIIYNPTLLLIEEPESHLHPKLQADLADFFAAASSRYNMQFAIETHSEYFIHKLRYLILKKVLPADAVNIYYIDGLNPKASQKIRDIRIREDGSLTNDFGSGFLDESGKWMELLKVTYN
jgi:predicted ATPase